MNIEPPLDTVFGCRPDYFTRTVRNTLDERGPSQFARDVLELDALPFAEAALAAGSFQDRPDVAARVALAAREAGHDAGHRNELALALRFRALAEQLETIS